MVHTPAIMGEANDEAALLSCWERQNEAVGNSAELTEQSTPGRERLGFQFVTHGAPVTTALEFNVRHSTYFLVENHTINLSITLSSIFTDKQQKAFWFYKYNTCCLNKQQWKETTLERSHQSRPSRKCRWSYSTMYYSFRSVKRDYVSVESVYFILAKWVIVVTDCVAFWNLHEDHPSTLTVFSKLLC